MAEAVEVRAPSLEESAVTDVMSVEGTVDVVMPFMNISDDVIGGTE